MVGLREHKCPFYERKYCVFVRNGDNKHKLQCPKEYQKDFTKCKHYLNHKENETRKIKRNNC